MKEMEAIRKKGEQDERRMKRERELGKHLRLLEAEMRQEVNRENRRRHQARR